MKKLPNCEVNALAKQAQTLREEEDMVKLWNKLKPLRNWILKDFSKIFDNNQYTREDAESNMFLGFLKALDAWDPNKSAFTTYFVNWGRAAVGEGADTKQLISIPRNVRQTVWRLNKETEADIDALIASSPEFTEEEKLKLRAAHVASKMAYLADNAFEDAVDLSLSPEQNLLQKEGLLCSDPICKILGRLSKKERLIICLSFGLTDKGKLSDKEIAAILGYAHPESVSRAKNRALRTLRTLAEGDQDFDRFFGKDEDPKD